MPGYVIRRLGYGLVTLLALSVVVFFLVQAAGTSPVDRLRSNPRMVPLIPELTEHLGLDRPAIHQYLTWLANFVTPDPERFAVHGAAPVVAVATAAASTVGVWLAGARLRGRRPWRGLLLATVWIAAIWFAKGRIDFALDWGVSFAGNGPVWDSITGSMGATFRLGVAALAMALLVGIPLGVGQAMRPHGRFDEMGTVASFLAFSTPVFVVGVVLQVVLALQLERWTGIKVFYAIGMTGTGYEGLGSRLVVGPLDVPSPAQIGDALRHLTLPALTIAVALAARYARFQRASMLDVLSSDHVRMARARGLPRHRVLMAHALRNALIPVVTLVSLDVAAVVGGAIITESIFGWPGIGRLYLDAVGAVDYPVVMAVVMVIGAAIVLMNLVADLVYGMLDPRVRRG